MEVKVLFKLSKDIAPALGVIKIGKYTIESLPADSGDLVNSTIRFLLRFNDQMRDGEKRSNPVAEAKTFLSFFSFLSRAKLDICSAMLNDVRSNEADNIYVQYRGTIESVADFDNCLTKLMCLDEKVALQFIRACEVYRIALNLIGTDQIDNTISFFLLTIVVECMASAVSKKDGKCAKFIDFIMAYLPSKQDYPTDGDWTGILKEVYRNHRSAFTHGGKEVPEAVFLADRLNRKYVRNEIDGKSKRTPGLKWFEGIVHSCLVNFLLQAISKDAGHRIDYFKETSLAKGVVKIKAKKKLDGGQFITESDVDLD